MGLNLSVGPSRVYPVDVLGACVSLSVSSLFLSLLTVLYFLYGCVLYVGLGLRFWCTSVNYDSSLGCVGHEIYP